MSKRQCCEKLLDQDNEITDVDVLTVTTLNADTINADTANITTSVVTTITGSVEADNGTEAAPSITFTSDPNTGVYHPVTADQYAISTGGTRALLLDNTTGTLTRRLIVEANSATNTQIRNSSSDVGFIFNTTGINFQYIFANGNAHNCLAFRNGAGTNGLLRWGIQLASTESGADAGSDFRINRYDDAGTFLGTAFTLMRATGILSLSAALLTTSNVPSSTANALYNSGGDLFFDAYKLNTDSVVSSAAVGTLTLANDIIRSTGAQTVTLPVAANSPGKTYTIMNTAAHTTTIARSGSDTIDDGVTTSIAITAAFEHATLKSDGVSVWMVV